MKDENEKMKLLKELQEAASSETLSDSELESVDGGGVIDVRCVNNNVPQCGCQIKQETDIRQL
ncbi:hypothetical protein [Bacteroides caecigallinarum]|uniref:hypothetical protein n=1 Tax=Bacteroides caecigallinarum TaxID=1411144 RepID=UPI00195B4C42|nr:hypothetical protein [Bacteroides caecigallinarum]MBM6883932.1 hypothetical protein [Bacteroides caecigallinarum]MDN0073188.1 hypothetical protein [Bacteroides caecigallinarum]